MRKDMTKAVPLALATEAWSAGAQPLVSPEGLIRPQIEWDVSGKCTGPESIVELYSRIDRRHYQTGIYQVSLRVPCRQCAWCRKVRAMVWQKRALAEYHDANLRLCRTWFLTLTYNPHQWNVLVNSARLACAMDDIDMDALPTVERNRRIMRENARQFDLYWKKVRAKWYYRTFGTRQKAGHQFDKPFRYLCIAEVHKSGVLHFHALVHEGYPDAPLRKRDMKDPWEYGFSKVALVNDPGGAVYVTKYLTKSDAPYKVRSSKNYGALVSVEGDEIPLREKPSTTAQNKVEGGAGISPSALEERPIALD